MKDLYLEQNISQAPAIELLQSMGYSYISPEDCMLQRGSNYDVLLKDILRGQLRKINCYKYGGATNEFSASNIERAIEDIDEPLASGLVQTSERIYNSLLLGKSYPELVSDGRSISFNMKYIDWENPKNNVFNITQEYAVESQDKEHNARPDIVLFINGIPFAVIECKSPQISEDQAVEQMIRNQTNEYIPQLFKFTQILVATNKNKVKYATTGTQKKFWSVWKEENKTLLDTNISDCISDRLPTEQDKNLISLFSKERVYDFIKYFIIYDANIKKICRYQQFFAVKEIIKTIEQEDVKGNRQSGVIWHTQGSGKSLTMVMLAKYILMELSSINPKVIIVTDRKELDKQITKTFSHTRLHPARATSGQHLVDLIASDKADIVTTVINKFNTAERLETKMLSKDIFILVDESHRSNYGQLSAKMRRVFPNACYIGFTGTPLMKKERSTVEKFGTLIHSYTISDGVADKAIVPLIYEGKFVEQKVDEENIDLWFEETTKRLTESQQQDLKKKWASMKYLASTEARIRRIALDINNHYIKGFKNTGFKALLATNRKKDAVRYLECFEKFGDVTCGVVISPPDMRESTEDIDEETDDKVIAYWTKIMRQYGDEDNYEESMKNKFIDGDIDILIVCSKLLTGFDAPLCQVLYIDKNLQEHGLLQAIARTNRLYDGKDYGLIVDYRGLLKRLDEAMDMYSGAGLENFNEADLKGTIVDVISAIGDLRGASTKLEDMFCKLKNNRDTEEIEVFLADDDLRKTFYDYVCELGKYLNIVLNSEIAYDAIPKRELQKYQDSFIFYTKVRRSIKFRYFESIDNKEYEPLMQNLLDNHLSVVGLKQITNPLDILNKEDFEKELNELGSLRAKADSITSKLTKSISKKRDENPLFYDSFSKRIKDVLEEYKNRILTEAEYLEKMQSIMEDYSSGKADIVYPEKIKKNVHAQAFFGVLNGVLDDEININEHYNTIADLSIDITKIIEEYNKVDWSSNITIHNQIAQAIDDLFFNYQKNHNFSVSFNMIDKVIENIKTVALRRF